jgi:hypothetical protein
MTSQSELDFTRHVRFVPRRGRFGALGCDGMAKLEKWNLGAGAVAAAFVLLVAGCAGDDSQATTTASIAEVEQAPPLGAPRLELLTAAEINETRAESPERAFLRYWSALQYSAWNVALAFYEKGLVQTIGPVRLIEALKGQASYFPTTKPQPSGRDHLGGQVIVRYGIADPAGQRIVSSITLRRRGSTWRIHYQPFLDAMLRSAAQTRIQTQVDPNATRLWEQALRAGAEAARLQSDYLRRSQR